MEKNKTKIEQEQLVKNGNRITGRKASAERYISLYEFLLFDPKYREMKDKAKILYSFLRNKSIYFEKLTEAHEEAIANGEEPGTKSYRDNKGDIFCIADNSELSIILQCHPNRVGDQKKELMRYGLLEEVPRFNPSGHKLSPYLYVLIPKEETLTDTWMYIEEMKQLRVKTQSENKAKAEKLKEKKNKEKVSNKAHFLTNSQDVSESNSQDVSESNSQDVSKNIYKGFKSNQSIETNLNLSIREEIENTTLPINLQKLLINKIDRLIEFNINIADIDLHFKNVQEKFKEAEYQFVLNSLLNKISIKPNDFAAVMNDWLDRNRKKQNEFIEKKSHNLDPVRKELLPEWYDEENNPKTVTDTNVNEIDMEKKLADVQKRLEKYKNNDSINLQP